MEGDTSDTLIRKNVNGTTRLGQVGQHAIPGDTLHHRGRSASLAHRATHPLGQGKAERDRRPINLIIHVNPMILGMIGHYQPDAGSDMDVLAAEHRMKIAVVDIHIMK